MKGCVEEYRSCPVHEIAEKYIEGEPEIGTVGVHADDTNRVHHSTADSTISGSNSEDATLTEGTIYYDVRFNAIAPKSDAEPEELIRLIINVEAQNKVWHAPFRWRADGKRKTVYIEGWRQFLCPVAGVYVQGGD